jgi:RNA methyltransferase, TrmH family
MSPRDIVITSTANRHIVEARKLKLRKHRERQGRFLLEGLQLLHMALDAGALVDTVFYCEEQFTGREAPALLARFRAVGAECLPVSTNVMEQLSEREVAQGLFASFVLAENLLDAIKIGKRSLVVVLDRLQDPGNLGTLIRTADAVGAAGVVLIEPGVDLYDPKTLRASMGSFFNLPVVRTPDVAGLFGWLKKQGAVPVGARTHDGKPWGAGLFAGSVALVLGNEARGLSPDIAAHIAGWAHLPMAGKAESLNVSIAGGVLMYEWLRVGWNQAPGS